MKCSARLFAPDMVMSRMSDLQRISICLPVSCSRSDCGMWIQPGNDHRDEVICIPGQTLKQTQQDNLSSARELISSWKIFEVT